MKTGSLISLFLLHALLSACTTTHTPPANPSPVPSQPGASANPPVSPSPDTAASNTPVPVSSSSSLTNPTPTPSNVSPSSPASTSPTLSPSSNPIPVESVSPEPEPDPEPTPQTGPFGNSAALSQAPTDGLVAYYNFDGDTQDSSGQGNHGEVNGEVGFVNQSVLGQAVEFDGHDQNAFIQIPSSESLALSQSLTVSAWVRLNAVQDQDIYPIVSKGLNVEDYTFWALKKGPELLLNLYTEQEFWGHADNRPDLDDAWHLLTVSYDGSKVIYYLDAQQQTEFSFSEAIDISEEDLYLGMSPAGAVERFKGLLDEVRIYNRALSADEIKRLMLK